MKYENMLSIEDKMLIKACRNLKDFLPTVFIKEHVTEIEKTNIGRLSAKVLNNLFDRTQ